jgi:hypothetical protein
MFICDIVYHCLFGANSVYDLVTSSVKTYAAPGLLLLQYNHSKARIKKAVKNERSFARGCRNVRLCFSVGGQLAK